MDADKRQIQERNLDILVRAPGGFQFTDTFFPYTSGEIGPYYVQGGVVQHRGDDFLTATKDMAYLVGCCGVFNSDLIAGGETRDWIFSIPVALHFNLPHTMIYKDGKTVGADMKDQEVVLVSDLNNEGSSPRDLWMPVIRKSGGQCNRIFFYVDRMERGVKVIEELGLQREAVVPLDAHAWSYLMKQKVISEEIYGNLMERIEDQDAWAVEMLRSDSGLRTLSLLVNDEKTRDKGKKILDKGYPKIKDELVDRMTGKCFLLPGISQTLIPGGI